MLNSTAEIRAALDTIRGAAMSSTAEQFDAWLATLGVFHKSVEGFHIFDYGILNVDWSNPVPHLCRGLVLDANWDLACLGLLKFFNSEEGKAATLTGEIRAFEKLDGTCLNRWWDNAGQRWQYSTRYNMGAGLELTTGGIFSARWCDLIRQAFDRLGPIDQPTNEVWTFELCSMSNRIVVQYPETHVQLLAIRDRNTLQERSISQYPFAVRQYPISSLQDARDYAAAQPGVEFEGLILVDQNWNRVKCKNPGYVWLHHMRDQVVATWRGVAALIQRNETSEFCGLFPEYRQVCDTAQRIINAECARMQKAVDDIMASKPPDAKTFAAAVQAARLSYPDYAYKRYRNGGESDATKAIYGLQPSRFLDWAERIGVRSAIGSQD